MIHSLRTICNGATHSTLLLIFHMLWQDSVPAAEDLFGSDSEMATTQELPGRDEEEPVADPSPGHEGDSGDEGGSEAAGDSNDGGDKRTDRGVSNPSGKGSGADLRSLYWNVVHEEQKKIKKSKPDMPGREVLKLARKAFLVIELNQNTTYVIPNK